MLKKFIVAKNTASKSRIFYLFMLSGQQLKIVFMGSADFSLPILIALQKRFNVVAVVTEIDKPAGRNKEIVAPPTKHLAQSLNIPVFQPISLRKDIKLIEKIKTLAPDLIVVAAYGKILPESVLNLPTHGCLNVHPSLLPKYRGASPIQSALLAGERVSGVSIILMDAGMDTGDIVAQETLEVDALIDYGGLAERLAQLAAEMLVKIIPRYVAGDVKLKTQSDEAASYCQKIEKADGKINWQNPAGQIFNQWRAYAGWPGVYAYFKEKKIDFVSVALAENKNAGRVPGEVFAEGKKYFVACGSGALELKRVKLEGKKEADCQSFVNGDRDFVGTVLK